MCCSTPKQELAMLGIAPEPSDSPMVPKVLRFTIVTPFKEMSADLKDPTTATR